jgi:hypothetical protein
MQGQGMLVTLVILKYIWLRRPHSRSQEDRKTADKVLAATGTLPNQQTDANTCNICFGEDGNAIDLGSRHFYCQTTMIGTAQMYQRKRHTN